MFRSLERIGHFEVRLLQEVTAHLREEEHDSAEDEQEHHHTNDVFHGVVRVERNTVERHTGLVLGLLDVHAHRVVRTDFVQRQNVQHHQTQNHDWQGDHMQGEEAVQRDTGDQVITADPLSQIVADDRNGTEQRNDHLGTPVGHLTPRQQIAHEGLSHQRQVDHHAEDPYQLARLLVGTIEQTTEHVQIDHDEERRSTGRMQVADDPAVLDITHDVFDGGKGALGRRLEAHGQPDTGQDLIDQHQQRQRTEEVQDVEVLGGVILRKMIFPHLGGGEAGVNPFHELAHQAFSWSTPMMITLSVSYECGGTGRFKGAGCAL